MKNRVFWALIGLLLGVGIVAGYMMYFSLPEQLHKTPSASSDYSVDTCYYMLKANNQESFDFAWIKFKILSGVMNGTYSHYSGTEDAQTGDFTGAVNDFNVQEAMHTVVTQWNHTLLPIVFSNTIAKVDNMLMNKISCDDLSEVIKNRGPKY